MNKLSILLTLFSAAVSLGAFPVEDGVLVLDDTNFEDALSEHSFMLVEFYAPWCGHCKKLTPEWAKAAGMLVNDNAKLAKVDATIATKLAAQFEIKGFPTIKLFKNKKPMEYGGGRTATEIVSWVKKQSGPAAITVDGVSALEALRELHESFVLGVFASAESESSKSFLALASADEANQFVVSYKPEVRDSLGLSGETVVVFKAFDEMRNDFDVSAGLVGDDVSAFIATHSHPLVQEFSQEGAKKIFSSAITNHALFFTNKADDNQDALVATFKEVAAAHRANVLFVNVPHTETRVMEYFGLAAAQLPALVLVDMSQQGKMKKYPYPAGQELSKNGVGAFVDSVLQGDLTPALKSEKSEPADTAGDVKVLKGETFKSIVLDNTKDVLVEFYAPWCGHCKKLAPTWDELGLRLRDDPNVVIAKMDSTANEVDVPGLAVQGFPTIFFFKGDDKANPIKYEGGREVDDFMAYLKTAGSNTLSLHSEL